MKKEKEVKSKVKTPKVKETGDDTSYDIDLQDRLREDKEAKNK